MKKHPNRRNPRIGEGSCLYTSHRDHNVHCIAGQAFKDLGLPVPDHTVEGGIDDLQHIPNYAGIRNHFSDDAWLYLSAAQCVFDGGYAPQIGDSPRLSVAPRKWSEALKMLDKSWEANQDD